MHATNLRPTGVLVLAALAAACEQTPVGLPEATSLVVTPERLELVSSDIASASAQVLDQNGRVLRGAVAVWSSSAPGVARVTPDGVVTAVAPGTATVSASYGSLSAELPVTVGRNDRDLLAVIELSRTALTTDRRAGVQAVGYRAFDGRGLPRCDAPLELSVSDRSVASVTQASSCRILVTPIGPGQSTVTVTNGPATASFVVNVTLGGEIAFFSTRPEPAEVRAGNTVTYRVRLLDGHDQPIANHAVNFDVTIGTIATPTTTTDEQGYASVEWRLPRLLRQRTTTGDVDSGSIIFRTQLAGYVHSETDFRQIGAGLAASLAFVTGVYAPTGLTFRSASEHAQLPLNTSVLILAETHDEYGNRRDPTFIEFAVNGQPVPAQLNWVNNRYLRGFERYEFTPRTLRVTARDGDLAADLSVEFTTGS